MKFDNLYQQDNQRITFRESYLIFVNIPYFYGYLVEQLKKVQGWRSPLSETDGQWP